ncbi:MAG TPA: acyl carrier protein [Candidatus Dormibacteraeota bacterium]|nr:acyl carrier protein [Candidatus Dormibacteraeota bacterium]
MQGNDALKARITRLFAERLNLDVPSADTDLFESGALDSMAFVELLARLEGEFGIDVALADIAMDTFRSIERIAGFVEERSRMKRAAKTG